MTKEQQKEAIIEFANTISETKYNYFITMSLMEIRKCGGFHRADATDISCLQNIVTHIANDVRKLQGKCAKRHHKEYNDLDFLAFPEVKTKGAAEDTHPHYHILIKIPDFSDDFHDQIKSRIIRLINKKEKSFGCILDTDIRWVYDLTGVVEYSLKHVLRHDFAGGIIYYSSTKR